MMQLGLSAGDDVHAALRDIGRTEDVQFSPDNSRLAVAGFRQDCILLLRIALGEASVSLDVPLLLECAAFDYPHGISWLDGQTIIVANRGGEAVIVRVPEHDAGRRRVYPIQTIRADDTDLLRSPGSVAVRRLSEGLLDIAICNNSAHQVTRHLVEAGNGYAVLSSEIVCREGLAIPDGIAFDRPARWMAVSNHNDHSVYVYRVADLGRSNRPAGVLRGLAYAHGLRFTPDGRHLLVADAGAPFVHVFHARDGDWAGDRLPVTALRVMDETTFLRGAYNEQEGGPKGIDISSDGRVLIVCCEEQPLAAFGLAAVLEKTSGNLADPAGPPGTAKADRVMEDCLSRLAAARGELGRLRTEIGRLREEARAARGEADQAHAAREEARRTAAVERERAVAAILSSTSWKVTAPLRALARTARRQR